MRPLRRQQRDLFEEERTLPDLPAAQRIKLVRLLEGMLAEAMADARADVASHGEETTEVDHEQDHA